MRIKSVGLKGGLYGQLLMWCLELLPYLKENDIYPEWDINSEYYGDIFGTHILINKCNNDDNESSDMLLLKTNSSNLFKGYGTDFNEANKLFFEYFSFSNEIIESANNTMIDYKNGKVLGLHYRGTDKINTEGGYINVDIFKKIVDDYLSNNSIDTIFIFSDEVETSRVIELYYSDKYIVKNFNNSETRETLLYSGYNNDDDLYKKTIIEPIILSKCDVVIKTASNFSAWSKIFNPNLEIYRVSAFKEDWFPDYYIPLYKSEDIKEILDNVFIDEKKILNE